MKKQKTRQELEERGKNFDRCLGVVFIGLLIVGGMYLYEKFERRDLQEQLSECQDEVEIENETEEGFTIVFWYNFSQYEFKGMFDCPIIPYAKHNKYCDVIGREKLKKEQVPNNESWVENITFNLTFKPSWMGYLEDEIPKDYIKLIIYEKSCWTDGSNCVYYQKEVYFPKNYEVLHDN